MGVKLGLLTFKGRLRMFENRVLGGMFGSKRDEVTGGWRKLHNEELHNLYSSLSITRLIKSRRMSNTVICLSLIFTQLMMVN
jgi:hypothetical protein